MAPRQSLRFSVPLSAKSFLVNLVGNQESPQISWNNEMAHLLSSRNRRPRRGQERTLAKRSLLVVTSTENVDRKIREDHPSVHLVTGGEFTQLRYRLCRICTIYSASDLTSGHSFSGKIETVFKFNLIQRSSRWVSSLFVNFWPFRRSSSDGLTIFGWLNS